MEEDTDESERKLRIALRLFPYSEDPVKLTDTMKVTAYVTPKRKGVTVYQRMHCAGEALQRKTSAHLPATVILGTDNNVSSVSLKSLILNVASSVSSPENLQSST